MLTFKNVSIGNVEDILFVQDVNGIATIYCKNNFAFVTGTGYKEALGKIKTAKKHLNDAKQKDKTTEERANIALSTGLGERPIHAQERLAEAKDIINQTRTSVVHHIPLDERKYFDKFIERCDKFLEEF